MAANLPNKSGVRRVCHEQNDSTFNDLSVGVSLNGRVTSNANR